jgi:hypothetical protein
MVGGSLRLLPPLKIVRHDIAEILLKVAINNKNQNQINRSASCSGIKPKMYRTLFTQHCHHMSCAMFENVLSKDLMIWVIL